MVRVPLATWTTDLGGTLINIPHAPTNRIDFNTFDSSGQDSSKEHIFSFHGEALTVALVVASQQRAFHGTKNEHENKTR